MTCSRRLGTYERAVLVPKGLNTGPKHLPIDPRPLEPDVDGFFTELSWIPSGTMFLAEYVLVSTWKVRQLGTSSQQRQVWVPGLDFITI